VSGIVVSELEYGPPGGDQLFFDVSFRVAPGEHAAIVGANGVGKSTILRQVGLIQLLAQVGAYAVLSDPAYAGKLPLFGGIDGARFRKQVVPGDELELVVELGREWHAHARRSAH